jgi:hypothetical protein
MLDHILSLNIHQLIQGFSIPQHVTNLTLKDVTAETIDRITIPEHVVDLTLDGYLQYYTLPDHLTTFECSGLGLESLTLNDRLEYLFCYDNPMTTLELPADILCVIVSNNKLTKITARQPLTRIETMDVRNNQFGDFDLKLPYGMSGFWMAGNPNMRIRHMDFLFEWVKEPNGSEWLYGMLMDGDFKDCLGNGELYCEAVQARVAQHSYSGKKYIDVSKY